jgi:hypothetical protein
VVRSSLIEEQIMSILLVGLLALGAIGVGVAAAVIVGTIVLTNFFGVNYEVAGRQNFFAGLAVILTILGMSALSGPGAVVSASLWILGVSGTALAGWLLLILSRRWTN